MKMLLRQNVLAEKKFHRSMIRAGNKKETVWRVASYDSNNELEKTSIDSGYYCSSSPVTLGGWEVNRIEQWSGHIWVKASFNRKRRHQLLNLMASINFSASPNLSGTFQLVSSVTYVLRCQTGPYEQLSRAHQWMWGPAGEENEVTPDRKVQ